MLCFRNRGLLRLDAERRKLVSLRVVTLLLIFLPAVQAQLVGVFQQGDRASVVGSGSSATMLATGLKQPASATLTLIYTGASILSFPVRPELFGSSDFSLEAPAPATPLDPQESIRIAITYTPTRPQEATALLVLPFAEGSNRGVFTMALNGNVPVVTASYTTPSRAGAVSLSNGETIDFGQSIGFTSSDVSLSFQNSGSASVQFHAIRISGDSFQMVGPPVLPATLASGSQIQFSIRFQPRVTGTAAGSLQTSFGSQEFTASLSGIAILSAFSYRLVDGSTPVPLTPGQNIELGDVKVGSSRSALVRFRNLLSSPAAVSTIAIAGAGLGLSDGPLLPVTLQPQDQSSVKVSFTPTTPGRVLGRLTIGADIFPITATGIGPLLRFSYQIGDLTLDLPAGGTAPFPSTTTGASVAAQFSIRNEGTGPMSIFSIAIPDPTGSFQFSGLPALPGELAPGETIVFTVTFRPQTTTRISAAIEINGVSVLVLSGAGTQDPANETRRYSFTLDGTNSAVDAGGGIGFPATHLTRTTSGRFAIANSGSGTIQVASIGLAEPQSPFRITELPSLPARIEAGRSLAFTLTFAPENVGAASGTLHVDSARFVLSGLAPAPPALPPYEFTGASGRQQPLAQPGVGLSLLASYPLDVRGVLAIATVSDSFVQDPAVRFSTGDLTVPFTIPANALQAYFPGGKTEIQLQTGTVAGTILLTPSFAVASTSLPLLNPQSLRLEVPRMPPVLLGGGLASQTDTGFVATVTGYTTTRSLASMKFSFVGRQGEGVGQSSVDLSEVSRIWFGSASSVAYGGQFSIEIPFSIRSTNLNLATLLRSITVQAANEEGASNVYTLAIPHD